MIARLIAILLFSAPPVFGILRLLTTGTDARYLWTALASSIGAAAWLVRPARRSAPTGLQTAAAAATAAALAVACATALGATSGPAIGVVCAAFGGCSAGGLSLLIRQRTLRHFAAVEREPAERG